MNIIKILRKFKTLIGLKNDLNQIRLVYYKIKRKKIIIKYYAENKVRKLLLGANISTNKGWLCSDLAPILKNTIYLDSTKKFPFKDNELDYINCEHMIEHLTWFDGLKMLKESFRVLKHGGKIRIATPDLKVFIDLYSIRDDLSKKYIHWSTDKYLKGVEIYHPIFVINNMFRNWKHQFLYDKDLLSVALSKAGFVDVKITKYGQSEDEQLMNLEQHGLNVGNIEMVKYETIIMEATKL